jgi:tRNA (guanosine-2'-O-)-methyltransferase
VLFGGELAGVSTTARNLADGVISVPMVGVTQSLNVSVAAAVVLNRLAQRRRQIPGCIGIQGDRRADFVREFIEREYARKPAQQGRRSR